MSPTLCPNTNLCRRARGRLATWVRKYPSVIAWVRAKIGRPVRGWRPYESWSAPGQPAAAEYLLDDRVRVFDSRVDQEDGLSPTDGIKRIRETLAQPGSVCRLIGLSGVGKTRLLEALFDPRVGTDPLDTALAFYCDLAEAPEPSPRDLCRQLTETRKRAIVLVDNCPPETHRALGLIVAASGSRTSLLTVEYDVRDDEPEATQVFRLEPASTGLIEQLIERRAPHVSQVDRHRIAELSDGNARVALALGNTVRRGEQLGSLSDQDLFHRLFHQRNTVDKELLRAAEICALVYSFDGETTEGDAAELPHLGTLAGLSAEELYRCVDELRGRDLVQRRGRWRALLPHALANKLAADALSSTPLSSLSNVLEAKAPQRLLVSFSRRLGYLHSSEQAQAIVRKWLSPDGLLGDFSSLSDDALKMLGYVAPVLPNELLSLIERAVRVSGAQLAEGRSWQRSTWVSLLRSIAYDPQHFERAASILADFAGLGSEKAFDNAATEFQELFHIYLSGTHATLDQRIRVAAALINSDRPAAQSLGVSAIDGLLHADHFSSSHDFAFGARPRDFGWQPKDRKEIRDWYVRAIQFAESQVEHPTLGERVRSVLASRFRELWRGSGAWAELDQLCRKIGSQGLWTDGWVAVRSTIRYDANGMPKDILDCLKTLENALRPKAVLESARAFLFAKSWGDLDDLEEEEEDAENSKGKSAVRAYDRANNRAQELGEQVAKDPHVLSILLPEAANKNAQRAWPFGRGLALGAQDAVTMWRDLIAAITLHVDEDRGYAIVCGFLRGTSERDRQLAEAFFDEALKHPILGPQFPYLQVAIDLDERALGRLVTATELRLAPAWAYRYLALGRATDPLPSDGLSELVMRIAEMNDGFPVATEILSMRAHAARDGAPFDAALIYCAQQLLEKCTFEKTDFQNDYNLAKLARHCLVGVEAEGVCRRLCQRLATALGDYRSSAHDYDDLIAVVFQVQPRVAMEEFLLGVDGRAERNLARHFRYVRRKPMFHVPERIVIE